MPHQRSRAGHRIKTKCPRLILRIVFEDNTVPKECQPVRSCEQQDKSHQNMDIPSIAPIGVVVERIKHGLCRGCLHWMVVTIFARRIIYCIHVIGTNFTSGWRSRVLQGNCLSIGARCRSTCQFFRGLLRLGRAYFRGVQISPLKGRRVPIATHCCLLCPKAPLHLDTS